MTTPVRDGSAQQRWPHSAAPVPDQNPVAAGRWSMRSTHVLDRMRRALEDDRADGAVSIMVGQVVRMPGHEIGELTALTSWPSRVATAHILPRQTSHAGRGSG